MKRTSFLTGLVAIVLVAGIASGSTIVYSTNYSESNPIQDPVYTFTFNQFDSDAGPVDYFLTKVTITFTAQQSTSVAFENGTTSEVTTAPELSGGLVQLSGTGGVSYFSFLSTAPISDHTFAANEGGGQVYSQDGADYYDFGSIESDTYAPTATVLTGDLSAFEGTGDISYDMTSVGSWVLSGVGDAQSTISDYITAGTLTVEYEYTPEPATMLLLSVGGIAMLKRRKHA